MLLTVLGIFFEKILTENRKCAMMKTVNELWFKKV